MIITQCVILARTSGKLIFIHENKVFDCHFSLNLAETKTKELSLQACVLIVVLIFSSSISQSSCLKADSSFIWKTTTHNRFVVLFTSEFYRVLKRNSSELIAMKHKLNYTVEVGSKLTTLFIFFILRIRERKLVRWLLEVELFMPCI